MTKTTTQGNFQQLFLRIALAAGLLSAVADRLGFWGSYAAWGNWENFEAYTRQLTFFLPMALSNISAFVATVLEAGFAILLLLGYKTKIVSNLTGLLLLIFALSMSVALGVKAPLDYSVWAGSAGAFLLACQPDFSFSLDKAMAAKR
ncbi:DoxX protein [Chitinophaga sp. sic0106]|uniref:DoxX protein n=1 Tax=Chitinophaga sp. sic0106 TaxID=2854785 RepID=UPI001C487468|nr:DoxX protein [Chitinophaga sp. sic0106]MBV7529870.1 DoxX protein [Chitinophaga sp. sic0106]